MYILAPLGIEWNPIPQYGKNASPRSLNPYNWADLWVLQHFSFCRPQSLEKHTEYVAFVPQHISLHGKLPFSGIRHVNELSPQGDSGTEISQFKNILQVAYKMWTSSITLSPHVLWQLACLFLLVPPTCEYSDGLHLPYSLSSVRGREPLRLEVSNLCSSKWWAWGDGRHLYSKGEDQRSADHLE